MKKDLQNIIVKDVLTDEQIKTVYDLVDSVETPRLHEQLGYTSYDIVLPQDIHDIFLSIAESIAGVKLELAEYNFSTYRLTIDKDGNIKHPLLYPHTDEAFKESRVTLDYQIGSNTEWEIIVDNWENLNGYTLMNNEILSFAGTHQVHWRPKKEFNHDEYLDAIFLHFRPVGAEPLSKELIIDMRDRGLSRYLQWSKDPGISFNVGTEKDSISRYGHR
jgi:hypothetical protein